ncbi:MAG TPA: hypothetical protein VGD42_02030 [Lysobacter sp.]
MTVDAGETLEVRRWRHSLRNELNVITMATSAAIALLDHGVDPKRAREHLVRADAACRRCRDLLKDWPAEG